jgi:hypothetical protein
MTTAPLRKATSRDEDEILALLDALRQAQPITTRMPQRSPPPTRTMRSSAIWRRRCFIAASM